MKIVITDDRFGWTGEEERVFHDAELITADCRNEADLARACAGADGILLNQAPMTGRVIRGLDRCRVISRYGTGCDNVDLEAAEAAGIWVTNVPGYCTEEVAEHALGLLLSCVRAIPEKDRAVRGGRWNINRPVRRMSGRVLGIVGFGATGRAFWEKVRGFAFDRILIADPRGEARLSAARESRRKALWGEDRGETAGRETTGRETGQDEVVGFDELVRRSDFISFHVPLNESTRRCVNEKTIAAMKDGVILVNTSRGGIIDEGALAAALRSGKIASAALDVFEREPLGPDHPFLGLSNVVLTDHSAYYSAESASELKTRTALNARDVLEGRIPRTAVNRPVLPAARSGYGAAGVV
ncbi:MAG: C-terminal binding protein [Treponema sp.]|jgi:D-3-phosphoglycerate dehydrogenase|nr:C-terminal binding protein [Treponema sp.]